MRYKPRRSMSLRGILTILFRLMLNSTRGGKRGSPPRPAPPEARHLAGWPAPPRLTAKPAKYPLFFLLLTIK
ncbi:hypothetical protein AHAS_Ahas13G0259400 [Arachis hypogaea]